MIRFYFFMFGFSILFSCASSSKTTIEIPQAGKCLIVGGVLLENNGIEEVYEAHTANIYVTIIGKSALDGKEVTEAYRVKTDKDGYFMIQNVLPGSYLVKGFEADIGYETHLLVSSRWEGNVRIYHRVSTMIDHTVRIWPPKSEEKIIDMGIYFFNIDAAWGIYDKHFEALENVRLGLKDKIYTMKKPTNYYEEFYPEWEWFE